MTDKPDADRPTKGARDQLINQAHARLDAHGIALSPSKVVTLVKEFQSKVQPRNVDFGEYLDAAASEINDKRLRGIAGQLLTDEAKSANLTPSRGRLRSTQRDPVGEKATWQVFVDRDIPEILARGEGEGIVSGADTEWLLLTRPPRRVDRERNTG
ncbi:hypothetical protein [Mycobacterium sp. SA01]|uniref:hypothetical protein n=1 Tax=Mycobacterium sp. SA01 TaxID=3238820 RepID=UPI00351BA913